MKNIGVLWDDEVAWNRKDPFGGRRSKDFAKYTELGEDENLKIFIAKYSWYSKSSLVRAFHWTGDRWEKVESVKLDGVYDKYKYDDETIELKKKINDELPVVNNPELEQICKDKLKTYRTFSDYIAETRKATTENAGEMLKQGKIVFKPRYGFAGQGVEVIDSPEEFEEPDNPEDFIIQRFIPTDGASEFSIEGAHDLRTIVIDGELQNGNYIRVPEDGLISNISRGGNQKYVSKSELPNSILEIIENINNEFEGFQPAIFSVDFMFDDENEPWIIELNSKPGTYYHHPVKQKEEELPKIKNILSMIRKRLGENTH